MHGRECEAGSAIVMSMPSKLGAFVARNSGVVYRGLISPCPEPRQMVLLP
jgi:hypothetical protein